LCIENGLARVYLKASGIIVEDASFKSHRRNSSFRSHSDISLPQCLSLGSSATVVDFRLSEAQRMVHRFTTFKLVPPATRRQKIF
jgi:hypothetical protein